MQITITHACGITKSWQALDKAMAAEMLLEGVSFQHMTARDVRDMILDSYDPEADGPEDEYIAKAMTFESIPGGSVWAVSRDDWTAYIPASNPTPDWDSAVDIFRAWDSDYSVEWDD